MLSEGSRFLAVCALSALVAWCDPFGLGDALRVVSRDTFYHVAATAYPSERSPRIVVVLATDSDLAFLRTTWPLDHRVHADVVREVTALGARALLFDFVLLDVRDEAATNQLERSIVDGARTMRVVMASPEPLDVPYRSSESRAVYERLRSASVAFADIRYDHVLGRTVVMPGSTVSSPTAGVALYDAHCVRPEAQCAPLEKRRDARFELFWRGVPSQCAASEAPPACSAIVRSLPARFGDTVVRALLPEWRRSTAEAGLYPYPVLSLERLFTDPDAAAAVAHATVLYGSSFTAAADVSPSPTYGMLPGVFGHAALFDNLVVWGDRSFAAELPGGLSPRAYELVTIFVIAAMQLAFRTLMIRDFGWTDATPRFEAWCTAVAFLGGIVVAATETLCCRTSPENWLSAPVLVSASSYVWVRGWRHGA